MPHRLALLLLLLHIVRALSPISPSPTPNTAIKAVAVPHRDVFIPLKEWKRQRLEDIESRVRQAEQRTRLKAQRRSGVCPTRVRWLTFLCGPMVCLPPRSPTHSVVPSPSDPQSAQFDAKYQQENASLSTDATANAEKRATQRYPMEEIAVPSAKDAASTGLDPEKWTPSPDSVPVDRPGAVPVTSQEPDEITDHREGDQDDRVLSLMPKVLPNVIPNGIPNVGNIMKSLREASRGFGSPPSSLIDSFMPGSRVLEAASVRENAARDLDRSNSSNQCNALRNEIPASKRSNHVEPNGFSQSNIDTQRDTRKEDSWLDAVIKHRTPSDVKKKPFNFASGDAGARVLAFSNEVVGAKNVIESSDDKYMLAPCQGSGVAGSRWIDIELSEEVILESVETGNFEYYSSSPRKVAMLGASTYPPEKWNVLGIFEFGNVKTLQKFRIDKRGVTRYIRMIFAGKQGGEYYCPISTVRAFGKNLIADWKDVFERPPQARKGNGESPPKAKANAERNLERGKSSRVKAGRKDAVDASSTITNCTTADCGASARIKRTPNPESPGSQNDASNEGQPSDPNEHGMKEKIDSKQGQLEQREPSDTATSSNLEPEGDHAKRDEKPGPDDHPEDLDVKTNLEGEEKGDDGEGVHLEEEDSVRDMSGDENDQVSEDDQVVIDALQSDTLSPVHGDDNIFRKVTRMLRLLELNQTLTNQYIDTQLSKFALALSEARSSSGMASGKLELMERTLGVALNQLQNRVEEQAKASFRRDVLVCILLICIAFLLGTHWILWAAVSSSRLHDETATRTVSFDSESERIDRILRAVEMSPPSLTTLNGISSEGPSPAGRKKKRKSRRPGVVDTSRASNVIGNKLSMQDVSHVSRKDGRSVSSFELSSSAVRRQGRNSGGTFDVLGRITEETTSGVAPLQT